MKNKALTYILLIVVAIVWYQVFVRVKSNFADDESLLTNSNLQLANYKPVKRDTIQLELNYRDPFGSNPKTEINLVPSPIETNYPKPLPPQKPDVRWPKINYFGLVRKTNSQNPLGIVNIDGMLLHLRKGEVIFDEIKIVSVTRDSILVKYRKQTKSFMR